jgi:beta-N-acetylhexosaminidase
MSEADQKAKAAELMCIGLREPVVDDTTRELLDLGVAGVLLYDIDLPDPQTAHELIYLLKQRAGRPILVAVDHEGAARSRLQRGFTVLPPMERLGRLDDVEMADQVGVLIGRELRAVGIDMALGPVLDVATNRDNPIIGDRSIGRDAAKVARLATALARAMQREGVAACGKHFPGHGDTELDSNKQLPVLSHRMGRLESVELVPFEAAVKARFAAMMVAHILFPALDPKRPASISRPILYGLLRQRLGYRGMVLSDDVDMAALRGHFTLEEIAAGGIEAGVDCFLCARRPRTARELVSAIGAGLESGAILPERVEASRRRIQALIHGYGRGPVEHPDLSVVGCAEHLALVDRLPK